MVGLASSFHFVQEVFWYYEDREFADNLYGASRLIDMITGQEGMKP